MGLARLPAAAPTCSGRAQADWQAVPRGLWGHTAPGCARAGWRAAAGGLSQYHSQSWRRYPRAGLITRAAGPGGGVLDRPAIGLPDLDIKKDTRKQRPRFYRVMLHNDNFNRREYVVQVLLKVIDGLTIDDAVNVMQEAHQNGLACVVACAQEDAERYCEGLRGNGLIASIEPSGSSGGKADS